FKWSNALKDQFDNLEKHTQWGIEFLERYTKFVKERSEIELSYAKQIRNLSKKYQLKKNSKEEEEFKYTTCRAFLITLNELNDYAGQHEVIAENLSTQIIAELSRYTQELKAERKSVRTCLFHTFIIMTITKNSFFFFCLFQSKRRFERDCKEADRAQHYFDKMDADINVTKADVEKAKQQAQMRHQIAEDSKNEYLTYLQKFNKDQHEHYYTLIPHIFQRIQEMEERRVGRVRESMRVYTEVEHKVLPIVSKCLDGMTKAAESIDKQVVESYKSGFEPPGDVEFEDYSVSMKRAVSESSFLNARGDSRRRSRSKLWPLLKRNKVRDQTDHLLMSQISQEDYSHLPPEQRRKKLQAKLNDINRDIQKEMDQRDALTKMKDVYIKNPHLGDPDSVDPRLEELTQSLEKLQLEAHKFEVRSPQIQASDTFKSWFKIWILRSKRLIMKVNYALACLFWKPTLPVIVSVGQNEGTISMAESEMLYVIEEDKGDGWTRVRRNEDEEGYVPTSYIKLFLDMNAKGAMTYI
uniref:Formin binding protein 1a n=1 Tax=Sinocyclocheilus rhinocerous TaxID=307959 RepID=A0A673LDH7_9TELE